MKKTFPYFISAAFLVIILFQACKKERSCEGCINGNQPPIANAGRDTSITLPSDSATLDGSASTDPDGTIVSYKWTNIAGPSSLTLANDNAVQTKAGNLVSGTYQFELKVTDAGGLTSRDTVQVIVHPTGSTLTCNDLNRPTVTAQLISIGKLSKARSDMAVASAGTKIVFAGGSWTKECPECWGSPQVDIYDTVTKIWTTATLSTGRWGITAIVAGNKIFFAGGEWGDGAHDTYYTNVDIYDASTNSWSVEHLSETRSQIGAAVVGDKLFFAGGEKNPNYDCSDRVDIYNLSAKSWSTATLSIQRAFISAVSVGDKVYFAGGSTENRWFTRSDKIDIYDNRTNTWATSALKFHTGGVGGIVFQDNIYWSQGCPVEIRNAQTGTSKLAWLSHPNESYDPVVKNNKVVFISGGDKFDIYDPSNDKWTIGLLPRSTELTGNIVSVNNTIYFTDGDQVYKLEF